MSKIIIKISTVLIFFFASVNIQAHDNYITTSELNLRSGAGKNYSSIMTLKKGDTIKLLESSNEYWVKIQFQDKIGYSAKKYIKKLQIPEIKTHNTPEIKTDNIPEGSNSYITVLIFLLIVLIPALLLMRKGEKHRHKSTAIVLSFLFGIFGFQQFYLGKKYIGIISIIFFWTFVPLLIGLFDFIRLAIMDEDKFNSLYNQKIKPVLKSSLPQSKIKSNLTIQPNNSSNQLRRKNFDDTIVDVNSENLNLTIDRNLGSIKMNLTPANWENKYIFSFDEIKKATEVQKEYYTYFKDKVTKGEFTDIKGNTNYAFILYFDLLNDFENHKNIDLLTKQFKLLNEICPKTRSYTLRSLQDKLKNENISNYIDKSNDLAEPNYQFHTSYLDYNPDLYKLGNEFKEKLKLTNQEVIWLNKFHRPTNIFTSIEGCCIVIIKQYLSILKELNKQLQIDETSFDDEVARLKQELKKLYIKRNPGWFDNDSSFHFENQIESDVYLVIFKRIENSIRESYGITRKVSEGYIFTNESLLEEFEIKIGNKLNKLILIEKGNIPEPDFKTQLALNSQNVNRWKIEFEDLKKNYKKEDEESFINAIAKLEESNQRNPNLENIFFEACKFIARFNNVQALQYYAKYVYYDLKSKEFNNKELTKTLQKSLFKTDEQINDFKEIIADLIKTKDIQTALNKIPKIYISKRRKIQFDLSEIQEVEEKHVGTVELLNEYLVDDKIENETTKDLEETIDIVSLSGNKSSIYIAGINLNKVQEVLIKMIVESSYEIQQNIVDKYAIENGMFKNQLIDSINEICADYIDGEVLIEEEGENYVIEESYYNEIIK